MAILILATGQAPRATSGGNLITVGGQGQPVMQQRNNNRSHSRGPTRGRGFEGQPGFTNLDNWILSTDGAYDALSDKTPWETYAANIAGDWQLCANCQPDYGAKKLYRQYNYNRFIQGLAPVSAPIDDTEFADCSVMDVGYFGYHTSTPAMTSISFQYTGTIILIRPALNQIANPTLTMTPTTWSVPYFQGSAEFGFFDLGDGGGSFMACQLRPDGAPGRQVLCRSTVFS